MAQVVPQAMIQATTSLGEVPPLVAIVDLFRAQTRINTISIAASAKDLALQMRH